MGPNNSNCDSLISQKAELSIELVRQAKFRVAEQLKVSRYKSPRHVWYFSCDGQVGYLIAKETEDEEILFEQVKKEDWETLLNAKDPITTYQNLKSKYEKN